MRGDGQTTAGFRGLARVGVVLMVVAMVAAVATAGTIQVTNTAYSGQYGAEVAITDATPTYVQDDTPAAEQSYRVRFYVRNTNLTMATVSSARSRAVVAPMKGLSECASAL